jgi:hypothetical protein
MSAEEDSRQITLNYTGGSVEMSVGNAKSIFGDDFADLEQKSEATSVTVKSHTRTRVIGGDSSNVSGYTYTYDKWPTSQAGNGSSGRVILMTWDGSDGDWTARVTGSFADAGTYFNNNTTKTIEFRSERGTKYGPYAVDSE